MQKPIILFKYTSRSRRDFFFRGLDSIVNNLSDKENYWVQCTFDLSDSAMCDDEVITRLNTYKNLSYYFGVSENKIDAINKNLDKLPPFHILVNFSDDQMFLIPGFDDIIREDFKEAGGFDWFIHYPDSHVKERLATMSIMGVDYFKRDGYIYHPKFRNVYSDNYAQDLAIHRGRYKFVNKPIQDHYHPAWGTGPKDDQYALSENPEAYAYDHAIYLGLKAQIK